MMAEKARLFVDPEMLAEIIQALGPQQAKASGRKVRNFNTDVWSARCFEIVVNGNVQKFRQNPAMQEFLLSMGDAILVEAALRDQI